MSALAKYCALSGNAVSGSDNGLTQEVSDLKDNGIKLYPSHNKKNVKNCDLIVYTSAIQKDNEELVYASENKIKVVKRSELLGQIVKNHKNSVGVSGSHGKTTTTAMITHVLYDAKLCPLSFIGGYDNVFSNLLFNKSDFCVFEACEYRKNFLDLSPKIAVVLNIDNDHLDSYGSMENMTEAFKTFIYNRIAILNADDKNCKNIMTITSITFGIKSFADYMAKKIRKEKNGYSFSVYEHNRNIGRINLNIIGKHNIYNALATVAVADYFNIPFSVIKKSLENFSGVKRRNELIGKYYNLSVYCDYAHHPKEIKAILDCYKSDIKKTVFVFQPHTYSRTKILMKDFIGVFSEVKTLIVYKTYSAREQYDSEGSAKKLYDNLKKSGKEQVFYANDDKELARLLKKTIKGKTKILFIGAGDIYYIAKQIIINK